MALISTGIERVDEVLGGGLPRGRMVELFGPPGCGKSTIGMLWAAAAQRAGATVVYVDAERTLTAEWARQCGLDLDDLTVLRPETGEAALAMVESLLRTFTVDLVVIDSAAALVPAEEAEAVGFEDVPAEAHTDMLYRWLRRLQMAMARGSACLLFLNQTRAADGNDGRTAGGRSLALYAAVRVRIDVAAPVRIDGEPVVRELTLTAIKNKLAEPFLEARVELRGAGLTAVERKPPMRQTAAAGAGRIPAKT